MNRFELISEEEAEALIVLARDYRDQRDKVRRIVGNSPGPLYALQEQPAKMAAYELAEALISTLNLQEERQ